MEGLRRSIQENFYNTLMILLAGGFVMLLVELLLLQHTQGLQLVAIVSVVLGLILSVAALFVRGGGATVISVLLLIIGLIGIFGVFAHYGARQEAVANFQRFAQARGGAAQATQTGDLQATPAPAQEGDQQAGAVQGGNGALPRGQGGGQRPGFGGRGGAAPGAFSFREPTPPPLAPLGLTGLSLIAAVVVLGGSRKDKASVEPAPASTAS